MIRRIVKMEFESARAEEFSTYVKTIVNKIAAMPGCHKVYVLRDANNTNIFFTYSYWDDQEALDNYRHSELFKEVWGKTKQMFSKRAEAWSTQIIAESE